ncbi:MAG: fatty acyl-AMP ligase [Acidobacteriota bacterium]
MRRTLPEAIESAATTGSGFVFVDEPERDIEGTFLGYAELRDRAARVGGALRARGLRRGDRVLLVVAEPRDFLTAFAGASLAGLVPVPVYPPMKPGDLGGYLRQTVRIVAASRAAAIVTSRRVKPFLGTVAPSVRFVAAMEDLDGAPVRVEAPAMDDVAFLQFTSGSTAEPKGVILTHGNLAANVEAIGTGLRIGPDDVGVSWLPLYHDMGLIGMALASMYHGTRTVILSPLSFLKRPSSWLRAISHHRGTVSFAPSFAYALASRRGADGRGRLDLSSWRVAGCGAEPVSAAALDAFADRFAPVGFRREAFLPCYGMAEHTLAVTFPSLDRGVATDGGTGLVSCGRAFPGHALRIVNDGVSVEDGEVGEIEAAGPSVTPGYEGRPDLTAAAFRDGWLRTGDLGFLRDGELHVCGRSKDLIIVNGRNHYPQDLEEAAAMVAAVRRGSVAAFSTGGFGLHRERVVIVAETRGDGEGAPEAIARAVLQETGVKVDEVVVVPPHTIPKTSSGKVQRARTRARHEAGDLVRRTAPLGLVILRHALASRVGYLLALGRRLGRRR